ncbi:replication restart helicase PriA [Desulfoscipio gibsoniae]|uniref:Replication restart protein PriA n=1 Tax=Desulfoscipio gibsoniae DSM 7213 TaxID=767817 RepID=R4KNW0_9FIRM|nr:primosomal protein N' [Desulfoscipio gibsoniae]AGL02245.1 primosomal protein N'' [Desulfoscipio gibsoniae DSM 7213]
MNNQLYADILVEVPGMQPDRTYQYKVPRNLVGSVQFGNRVKVPFGKQKVTGFVVGLSEEKAVEKVKEIINLVDNGRLFREDQLELAKWLAGYYFCSTVKALQAVIAPALKKTTPRPVARLYSVVEPAQLPELRRQMTRSPKRLAALETALQHPGLNKRELASMAGVSLFVVNQLCAGGILKVETNLPVRDPYPQYRLTEQAQVSLTGEQSRAVQDVADAIRKGRHRAFMLHGVTGSGKTEVYLHCIEQVLGTGRQAITLVPEISLTPQMVRLYKARFGQHVAVLHSRMSDGERYDEWTRIENGSAPVVLGVRSAILAPVPDPGLIIIDEEHEPSYKQEEAPRYHARAVALYRARKSRGVLVLGSATPSLESYCRALPGGEYKLINMRHRINGKSMPNVQLVDMRREVQSGNSAIFSLVLLQKLREKLHNKEQAIIFLNRRGFKTLVVCRECGLVLKCPRCEISLTYHTDGRLRCHYCNYRVQAPKICPDCGGGQVGYFGTGTQRVEMELSAALPGGRILRMDADTTIRKGSHEQILSAFSNGEADILVGTQMVAKGLDLPGVTLVGVINADSSLHMPDFRAGERTFQLLAQVAGRTGRGDKPGEVLIQTHTPEHYAVQAASRHNYSAFFQSEIAVRKEMGYPPFAKMVRVLLSGKDDAAVQQAAEKIRTQLDGFVEGANGGKIMIVGPAPAPLPRLKEDYRWHIILWSADYRRLRLVMERFQRATGGAAPGKELRMSIDVDPMYIM